MYEPTDKNRNILLLLRFDGTAYHGWQVQKNAVTVQQVLQDALEAVLGSRPGVTGCSRTDAGVHACEYACNFRTSSNIPCDGLLRAFNASLPADIAVTACRDVPERFHARYSAAGKEYIYKIYNGETRDPFLEGYALHYPYRLDIPAMRRAAGGFIGRHDFSSFCTSNGSVADRVREVTLLELGSKGALLTVRVRADGFLYNMVRIIVGTLLNVSQGRIGEGDIPDVIAARSRSCAGPTAPPHGLYLNRVFYEAEAMN
jgi:tRNA pseudouridine38-40 synthase